MDRNIQAVFLDKHELVLYHSPSVAILKFYGKSAAFLVHPDRQEEAETAKEVVPSTVFKGVLIAPYTQFGVQTLTRLNWLLDITPIQAAEDDRIRGTITVNDVTDVVPQRPFNILLSDLTKNPVRL